MDVPRPLYEIESKIYSTYMHLTSKIQIGVLRLQCTSRRPHISPDNQEAKGYFPAVPVAESQSLTVLSVDADATSLPSGENATAQT